MYEPKVVEYLRIKHEILNIKTNIGLIRNPINQAKAAEKLEHLAMDLEKIEVEEPVVEYKKLKQQRGNVNRTITAKKRYHKDVTKFVQQLEEIDQKIAAMVNKPQESVELLEITSKQTSSTEMKKQPEPKKQIQNHYYIITIGWSIFDQKTIAIVSQFLQRSSYLKFERNNNMMIWKYGYDTDDEKAQAKSLQICAAHLLDVVRGVWGETDAEVFGKVSDHI